MKRCTVGLGLVAMRLHRLPAPGTGGHTIVANKVWEELEPQTRLKMGELLRHNPQYSVWVRSIPASAATERARLANMLDSTDIRVRGDPVQPRSCRG